MKTKSTTKATLDSELMISFNIDGTWEIIDFIDFFKSIEYLYDYLLAMEFDMITSKPTMRGRTVSRLGKPETTLITRSHFSGAYARSEYDTFNIWPREDSFSISKLQIKKVQFASPGSIDLLGLGKVINILKNITQYYIPNKADKEKAEILKQKRIKLEIQNLKEIGFTQEDIAALVLRRDMAIKRFSKLSESGKITDVNIN